MDSGRPDLVKVLQSLPRGGETLRNVNEAKTRLMFIDRVLAACGWADAELQVEEPTGTGDFIDYLLGPLQNPWMVVEANGDPEHSAWLRAKATEVSAPSTSKATI